MEKVLFIAHPVMMLISYAIPNILLVFFTKILFNKTFTIRNSVIFVILLTAGTISSQLFIESMFSSFLILAFQILLIYLILKCTISQSILSSFFSMIIYIFGEIIVALKNKMLHIPNEVSISSFWPYFWDSRIIDFVYFIAIFLMFYYKIKLTDSNAITKKNKASILVNAIITFLVIVPNISYFTSTSNLVPQYIIWYNVFAVLVFFLLSVYNTFNRSKLQAKTIDLEYQMLYNKTSTDLVNSLRGFKHDYANTLASISGYLDLNNVEGLKKYFKDLKKDYLSTNNLFFANTVLVNNPSLFGLVISEYYKAEQKGIYLTFDIKADLNDSSMNNYELSRILGVLWDNAIEAAQTSEKKFINFSIHKYENANHISISNSFDGEVNLQEIFKRDISSKGTNRGFGLWEVKKITGKYKDVAIKTSFKDNIFKHVLIIGTKKES